jgi:4-amino-4-deoxy-L-arabinose transferase-like glycosyltransferase
MTVNQTTQATFWPKLCLYLLAGWLVARLAFSIPLFEAPERVRLIENNTYLELAENLLEQGIYAGSGRENLDQVRTPIYPYFIAGVLTLSKGQMQYLALAQLLLSAGTCWLVYKGTRNLFSYTTALAAAWLFALDPNALYFSLTALTETLFVFWLAFAIYLLTKYCASQQIRWIIGSAVMVGIATLTRPIAMWLIPIWAACLLWLPRPASWQKKALTSVGIVAFAWLAFFPWQLRNYIVSGQFSLSPVGQDTIQNWIIAEGLAEAKGISRNEAAVEIARAPDQQQFIREILTEYPGPMLLAQAKGIYRTLMGFEYDNWMIMLGVNGDGGRALLDTIPGGDIRGVWEVLSRAPLQARLIQLAGILWGLSFNLLLYSSAFYGTIAGWKSPEHRWFLALLVLMAGYLLLGPAAAGQARFRVPALPALAILGGLGISTALLFGQGLFHQFRQKKLEAPTGQ